MALRISYCPYRLLFKHPFGTAHGLREGTDSVFIQAEEDGVHGYGEVTLPPYLPETVPATVDRLERIAQRGFAHPGQLLSQLDALPELLDGAFACRAGISMALIDLVSKRTQWPVRRLLEITGQNTPLTLVTLGISGPDEVAAKLTELPPSGGLKLKVGDPDAVSRIQWVIDVDNRRLMLDGNQGLQTLEEAIKLADLVGPDRLIGFEQPFGLDQDPMNTQLARQTGAVVFADESIQRPADLEARHEDYGGVNLKLMKCGGLDVAKAMADRSRKLGLKVMLGSMSESSLGCTAMAQLAGEADIVDLDGPWLIKNDPFKGIDLSEGRLTVPSGPGHGATLIADLAFTPIGT